MKARILKAAMFTPTEWGWGLPLILVGPPGIAKTSMVKALAKACNIHCEVLSVGERGEGAFGVTPVPQNGHDLEAIAKALHELRGQGIPEDEIDARVDAAVRRSGTVLTYPPPEWIRSLRQPDGTELGIVFIDEVNTAAPAFQAALMGGVLDRRFGGHQCGPRVRTLCAMNPVGHAAGGWELPAPTSNRAGHIDCGLGPDAEEWTQWLATGQTAELDPIDIDAEEARVMQAWPEARAWAAGLIGTFVRARPELLHKMPPDGDPAQSGPWPSHRTWHMAMLALAAGRVHNLTDIETDELVGSFIGASATGELISWIEEQDLPDPGELLDGKIDWSHDPHRLDRTAAVLGACSSLAVTGTNKNRVDAMWMLIAEVARDAKDLCDPPARAMVNAKLHKGNKTARDVLVDLNPMLDAARGVR